MSTNKNTPISGQFWDWMQSYWHHNREFPPAHPDWRKKADLVDGKVPAGQLPSYVDDVLEFDSYESLPQPGEKGKIYITTKDNKQFRWGGSAYIEINFTGKKTMIDTLGLDESTYYPVTIQCNIEYPSTIKVYRTLNSSMGVPSYSTHGSGFWCYYEFEVYGNGWGTNLNKAICNYQDEEWVKDNIKIVGYDQMIFSSNAVIYVRGGSKYWFDVNSTSIPVLHTSLYNLYGQTVEHTKSRIWSGGILMNANTRDIQNAVSSLENKLNDYVSLNSDQNVRGKKRFDTVYNSYTPDGLFDSNAKPLSTITPGGKNLLMGYRDYGSGQYYPRIGFTSDTNWSLGAIGNNFTIGTNNDGSSQFTLTSSGSLKINGAEVFNTNNFDPSKKVSASNSQYALDWNGSQTSLMRNNVLEGSLYHSGNLDITDYYKINNGGISNQSQLVSNGLQFISVGNSGNNFDGDLANKTLEGTFANFSGASKNSKELGFSLFAPTSINQGIYYKNYYHSGQETPWKKLIDSTEIRNYATNSFVDSTYIKKWENADAIGFSSGQSSEAPYIYHHTDGYVFLATHNFLAKNYALRTGSNATDTWANASNGLGNNPYIPGKVKNASGNSTLAAATHGNVMGFINIYGAGQGNPTDDNWWYRIKMLHDNAAGYYGEIAVQMTGGMNSLRYKRHENGSDGKWIEVWDRDNFNPESKAERENKAVGIGFDEGKIENPYMKHNSGNAYLATKNWSINSFIPKTHPVAAINQSQINGWNNSISQSSASEEVILEDDTLKIQPDEFSLEGSGSYDIGSRKKLVHILFRGGKELNIREMIRRQTIVVFNFSRNEISLNIEGLKPYPLPPGMQVTLYISDEWEILVYNETGFKKMQ